MCKIRNVLIIFIFFLSSCGLMPHKEFISYEGPIKPLSEVASIAEGQRMWAYINKIDDKWIVDPVVGGARFTKGIHVLPGERKFHWKYLKLNSYNASGVAEFENAQGTFEAVVKAGHSYIPVFTTSSDGKSIIVTLVDKGVNYNQECLKDSVLNGSEVADGC